MKGFLKKEFAMKKSYRLTQAGADELKDELAALVAQRTQIADRIKQARGLGDLSENAEYQTAREEQDRLESRISELQNVVQNIEIIKKPKAGGEVRLGSVIKLSGKAGITKQFQVVGTMEADPTHGKISDESPIGKALLGRKVGDKVEIKNSPTATYKIVSVS